MRRRDFLISSSAGGFAVANVTALTNADPVAAAPKSVSATAAFEVHVKNLIAKEGIPGASAAIVRDGRVLYAHAFGYADLARKKPVRSGNRFRIASSTKPITAIGIMQLVESGKLRLADRAFDVLSDFTPPKGRTEDPRLRTITVQQLLLHVGGFDSSKSDIQFNGLRLAADAFGRPRPAKPRDLIEYMMGQPLAFSPGARYQYSNLGYNMLGRIIEKVSSSSYEQYVAEHILAPAGASGMYIGKTRPSQIPPDEVEYWDDPQAVPSYSVYQDDDVVRPYAYGGFAMEAIDSHGGHVATATELARVIDAVPRLLKPETLEQMLARPDLPFYKGQPRYYALGVTVGGSISYGHNGALTWGAASTVNRLRNGLTFAIVFNRLPFDIAGFLPQMQEASATILGAARLEMES